MYGYITCTFCSGNYLFISSRSSHSEVFYWKGILKICSKFTGEHPCGSAILIKLLCNFIDIALQHGCSSVNLLHIFRTPFLKNTSGRLLLMFGWVLYIYLEKHLIKLNNKNSWKDICHREGILRTFAHSCASSFKGNSFCIMFLYLRFCRWYLHLFILQLSLTCPSPTYSLYA